MRGMIQYKKSLIKKNIKLIKGKKWYNQRFDGCINFIWMISEGELKLEKRKMSGGSFTSHFSIFENNTTDWYIDMDDIKRVSNIFLKKAKKKRSFSKKLIKGWEQDQKYFILYCKKIEEINLKKLSLLDLKRAYAEFTNIYRNTISSSSLIDGFALGTDEIVQKEINKALDKKKIKKGRGIIFASLTAPIHQSFINEVETALLEIALKISRDKEIKKIFIQNRPANIMKKIKSSVYFSIIQNHQKNYFWTKNNYYDNNILTNEDFIKEIKILLGNRLDVEKEIERIKKSPFKNKIEKRKLVKKLGLSEYLNNLLEISEDFTHWQDERKKITYHFTHYCSLLMAEIGQRMKYTLDQMKYLTSAEVLNLFGRKKISTTETEDRKKKSLIYQKGNFYEILSGKKAEVMIKKIFIANTKKNINDFRGLPASSGKVRGVVKIIKSVNETNKVNKGDILVAVMTRPDYIMGIKQAAAIITDEGGITCHAAIISRELGIPCVIGTKIATRVLKDGDLVEVNANHGVITVIKRK
jgi:phosphohistidine swiveling domain-containing protein